MRKLMPKYLYFYLVFNNDANYRVKLPTLEDLKSDYIGYVLNLTDNNVSEAAEILRISRPTIHNRRRSALLH
ncbi:MAG: helix-turn-helix domain-containing protein [Candidatus Aminicenantes bacterium]